MIMEDKPKMVDVGSESAPPNIYWLYVFNPEYKYSVSFQPKFTAYFLVLKV